MAGTSAPPTLPVGGGVAPGGGVVSPPVGGAAAPVAGGGDLEKLEGACPDGFMPKEGTNTGFPSGGMMRQFVVTPPKYTSKPLPLLMVLTGTVESTTDSMESHSRLTKISYPRGGCSCGPVRQCSTTPMDANQACNAAGSGGWNWKPWNEGAASGAAGMKWWDDEGPDARFMKEMVKCVATKWPVDSKRLFVTGISSGGTMTNRLLTFQSDFWAGGVPESGEWYLEGGNQAVAQTQPKIVTGRCCRCRCRSKLGPMFIITALGWPNGHLWMGLADYAPTCQAASRPTRPRKRDRIFSAAPSTDTCGSQSRGLTCGSPTSCRRTPRAPPSRRTTRHGISFRAPLRCHMTCEVGRDHQIYGK